MSLLKVLNYRYALYFVQYILFCIHINTVLIVHRKLNIIGRILITQSMKQTYKDTLTWNLIKQSRKTGQYTQRGKVYKGF